MTCTNDQDFADRAIALGDVLGALSIPDSLLVGDSDGQSSGSLNRLEAVLKQHIADNAHRTRAHEGLQILRAANNLRTGVARTTPRHVIADGNMVALVFDGDATGKNGTAYHQTYCWVLRREGGKIREGTAYLDTELITKLFS